ncbi:MAG: FHA domain-containing protein [Pseudomonadota bacterium]
MRGGGDIPIKPGLKPNGQGATPEQAPPGNDWSDHQGPIRYFRADIAGGEEPSLAEMLDGDKDGALTEKEFGKAKSGLEGYDVIDGFGIFQKTHGFATFKDFIGKSFEYPDRLKNDYGLYNIVTPRHVADADDPSRAKFYKAGLDLLSRLSEAEKSGQPYDYDMAQWMRGQAGQIFTLLGFSREERHCNQLMVDAARGAGRNDDAAYYLALRAMGDGNVAGVESLLKAIPEKHSGRAILTGYVERYHRIEKMGHVLSAADALAGTDIALMEDTEKSFPGRILRKDFSALKKAYRAAIDGWAKRWQGGQFDSTRAILEDIWKNDPEGRRGIAFMCGYQDAVPEGSKLSDLLYGAEIINNHVTLAALIRQDEHPDPKRLAGDLASINANAGEEGKAEVLAVANAYRKLPEYGRGMAGLISSEFEDRGTFVTVRDTLHGAADPENLAIMLGGYGLARITTAAIMGRLATTGFGEYLVSVRGVGAAESIADAGAFTLYQRVLTGALTTKNVDWSAGAIFKDWASLALCFGFLRATNMPLQPLRRAMGKSKAFGRAGASPVMYAGKSVPALGRLGGTLFNATEFASQVGAFYAGGWAGYGLGLHKESPKLIDEALKLIQFQAAARLANVATNGKLDRTAAKIRSASVIKAAQRIAKGMTGGNADFANALAQNIYMAHVQDKISARAMVKLGKDFAKGRGTLADTVLKANDILGRAGLPFTFDGAEFLEVTPEARARYIGSLRSMTSKSSRCGERSPVLAPRFRMIEVPQGVAEMTIGRASKSNAGASPGAVINEAPENISRKELTLKREADGWHLLHNNSKFNRIAVVDEATGRDIPLASAPLVANLKPGGTYRIVVEGRAITSEQKIDRVDVTGIKGSRSVERDLLREAGEEKTSTSFILVLPRSSDVKTGEKQPLPIRTGQAADVPQDAAEMTIDVPQDAAEMTIGRAGKSGANVGPGAVIKGAPENISRKELTLRREANGWRLTHDNNKINRVTIEDEATGQKIPSENDKDIKDRVLGADLAPGRYRVIIKGRAIVAAGEEKDDFTQFLLVLPPPSDVKAGEKQQLPIQAGPVGPVNAALPQLTGGSYRLIRRGGNGSSVAVDIASEGAAVIGRSDRYGALQVVDNEGNVVSARHATIEHRSDGSYWISDGSGDKKSTNGTSIIRNGSRIAVEHRPYQLLDGDVVSLGGVEFGWMWQPPAPKSALREWEPVFYSLYGAAPAFEPVDANGQAQLRFKNGKALPMVIKREAGGRYFIMDQRAPADVDHEKINPQHCRVDLHPENKPFFIGHEGVYEELDQGQWHEIVPGDTAGGGVWQYTFAVRTPTLLDGALNSLSGSSGGHSATADIAVKNISAAADIPSLKKALGDLPSLREMAALGGEQKGKLSFAAQREIASMDACLRGDASSDSLSRPVRAAFLKLIGEASASMKRQLPSGYEPQLQPKHALQRNAPKEESQYHALRAAIELKSVIEGAVKIGDVKRALLNSPLSFAAREAQLLDKLNGADPKSGARVKDIVDTANSISQDLGLQQKVWGLYFEGARTKTTSLDPKFLTKLRRLFKKNGGSIEGSDGQMYTAGQIEETVYRVLERGLPLEHVTSGGGVRELVEKHMAEVCDQVAGNDWSGDEHNYFTGEHFKSYERDHAGGRAYRPSLQRRYRFARMYLNVKEGRSIYGEPTVKEIEYVGGFVQRAFGQASVAKGDYAGAQEAIRRNFDNFSRSPHASEMREDFRSASPEERSTIVAAYFGPFRHRMASDPQSAVQFARFIGETGLMREVGVTLKYDYGRREPVPYISMGDLSYVSSAGNEHTFILHTHPVDYLNKAGKRMGDEDSNGAQRTIALESNADPDFSTLNVLFSRKDVKVFVGSARIVAGMAGRSDVSIFYEPTASGGIFRNWVQHPFGASVMKVMVDASGNPTSVDISYAINPMADLRARVDQDHLVSAQELRNMMEVGIPVTVTKVNEYKNIWKDFPISQTW